MTLLEEVREKMRERGYQKTLIESRAVAAVLDTLNDANLFYDYDKEKEEIERKVAYLQKQRMRAEQEKIEYTRIIKEHNEYIDKFNEALQELETPEARDRLKMAQTLYNTFVSAIEGPSERTALIYCMALTLSGVETPEIMKEFLNTKSFTIRRWI